MAVPTPPIPESSSPSGWWGVAVALFWLAISVYFLIWLKNKSPYLTREVDYRPKTARGFLPSLPFVGPMFGVIPVPSNGGAPAPALTGMQAELKEAAGQGMY